MKEIPIGGQQCGIPVVKQQLISDELSLKIEIAYHRSPYKNRELLMKAFEAVLNELVK